LKKFFEKNISKIFFLVPEIFWRRVIIDNEYLCRIRYFLAGEISSAYAPRPDTAPIFGI